MIESIKLNHLLNILVELVYFIATQVSMNLLNKTSVLHKKNIIISNELDVLFMPMYISLSLYLNDRQLFRSAKIDKSILQ